MRAGFTCVSISSVGKEKSEKTEIDRGVSGANLREKLRLRENLRLRLKIYAPIETISYRDVGKWSQEGKMEKKRKTRILGKRRSLNAKTRYSPQVDLWRVLIVQSMFYTETSRFIVNFMFLHVRLWQ